MWIVLLGFGTGKGAVQCKWHIYYGSPPIFKSDLVMFTTSCLHLDQVSSSPWWHKAWERRSNHLKRTENKGFDGNVLGKTI